MGELASFDMGANEIHQSGPKLTPVSPFPDPVRHSYAKKRAGFRALIMGIPDISRRKEHVLPTVLAWACQASRSHRKSGFSKSPKNPPKTTLRKSAHIRVLRAGKTGPKTGILVRAGFCLPLASINVLQYHAKCSVWLKSCGKCPDTKHLHQIPHILHEIPKIDLPEWQSGLVKGPDRHSDDMFFQRGIPKRNQGARGEYSPSSIP
jgi:hypothetical protein